MNFKKWLVLRENFQSEALIHLLHELLKMSNNLEHIPSNQVEYKIKEIEMEFKSLILTGVLKDKDLLDPILSAWRSGNREYGWRTLPQRINQLIQQVQSTATSVKSMFSDEDDD